jgi:ubiquinone/menaquinone biosynthesis C-methylase UbiE
MKMIAKSTTVASRDHYAQLGLSQIPRLLTLQDRNAFSPTYGCFHRDYWLYKTSDFADAVRQFGVHALALAYKFEMPGNIYKGNLKMRDWAVAGMEFWSRLQHKDGSFDEFYPNERGWVGPSAFTTFSVSEAFLLLRNEIEPGTATRILDAIHRAARFIAEGESEEDHLANHHAMACLAVWKAFVLTGDTDLERRFQLLWKGYLSYHHAEGWSREYDGVDPGYLSATVSFLAKVYQVNRNPEILKVLHEAVEFCGYFVYPNGFYAGSMGSRNTQHFYPHGFEILAGEFPLAAAIAEKMLQALGEHKLVPPDIMSDRYVFYRVPEFLQAYLDYRSRVKDLPPVSYEREPFTCYFDGARIFVANTPDYYLVANLAKGGVVKVFDKPEGKLVLNDCGLIGKLDNDKVVTSQWIDPNYKCGITNDGWKLSGSLNIVPSNKLFTPLRNIIFRSALVAFGWVPQFSHLLKGNIRKTLMLGQRPVPIGFSRELQLSGAEISIKDSLQLDKNAPRFTALSIGGEFFVRYVPQSRFFQSQELDIDSFTLDEKMLSVLNAQNEFVIEQVLDVHRAQTLHHTNSAGEDSPSLPLGVYDTDYYRGRLKKRQLIYRLKRRTDEVQQALRRYGQGKLDWIVDVGTADGLMLAELRKIFPYSRLLGLDRSYNLLTATQLDGIYKIQSDALAIPLKTATVDAVIATAVIEHVPNPTFMVRECARILRDGGLVVMTTPQPTMERISSAIGLLKEAGHQETLNLKQLESMFVGEGFEVLEKRKFMFSPVGFPAEKTIERIMGPLGLNLVMANQVIIGRRKRPSQHHD